MARFTFLVAAVLGACLVLTATAQAQEDGEPTPPPATPPAVETAVAPTDGETPAPDYEVTVNFNTTVTQDDIDEVEELLRAYDEDLDFVVMESWPPIGRALLTTDAADFCATVEGQLEAKTYVDDVSCGAAAETPSPDDETPPADEEETPVPEPPEPGTPVRPDEPPVAPPSDEGDVIAPGPGEPEPAPDGEEVIIAPPPTGAGSTTDSSWPWWPFAVGGAVAVGAAGMVLAYHARRAKP
jgi:hypothetical protein